MLATRDVFVGRITQFLDVASQRTADVFQVSTIDGVVLVESNYVQNRRVYAMVVLTFRYGREDEEVMGLKFYTEAVLDYRQVGDS